MIYNGTPIGVAERKCYRIEEEKKRENKNCRNRKKKEKSK
jgi:hypothetical protein